MTDKQIYDLNNMNVAAQNIQLGTMLQSMASQSVSGIEECYYGETTYEEISDMLGEGKLPVVWHQNGTFLSFYIYCGHASNNDTHTFVSFTTAFGVGGLPYVYCNTNGTWYANSITIPADDTIENIASNVCNSIVAEPKDYVLLNSSTPNSDKQFKLSVNDSGEVSITEYAPKGKKEETK